MAFELVQRALAARPVALLRQLLFVLTLLRWAAAATRAVRTYGLSGAMYRALQYVLGVAVRAARVIPAAESQVKSEVAKAVKSMEKSMIVSPPGAASHRALPDTGLDSDEIKEELHRHRGLSHIDWEAGKVSGAVYNGNDDLALLMTDAFSMYALTNPLHPDIFPGIRKMESEIVSMTLNMFNAPKDGVGNLTSGGTESILLACLAYRELGRAKKGITSPEMIVPTTVHAAFDKAGQYFNIKLIHVPVDEITGKVKLQAVEAAINSNTVMVVGSAPNFPHGIIDDIPSLARITRKRKIPLHVDCCLGGFLIPFMAKAGYILPHNVDFTVDGVTSISADTHKYGFAPKGSSVILYRNNEYRKHQYSVMTEWPGGVYATPTMAGSRPGALIAACWAAMLRFGASGYVDSTRKIVSATRRITKALSKIPNVRVIGEPLVSVVAFTTNPPVNVYGVAQILTQKGWSLNILQKPAAIHIAVTMLTLRAVDAFIADVKGAVETMKNNPDAGKGSVAAIYGTAASVPDRSIIADVASGFLDLLTKPA